jgi:ubiquinone/menaquinone biosynthesis C-methylase UbiE
MRDQIEARLDEAGSPSNVSVLAGSAEAVPLPEASVDIVHARFAYFFGTRDCLPGLAEVRRVLRPGGSMFVIEASTWGEFGEVCRKHFPSAFADQRPVLDFWKQNGFAHHHVETVWRAPDREVMRFALAMDLGADGADEVMARYQGCELRCGVHVFHGRAPFLHAT